jgi:crotonobetainyl-CoA:carnitine CoA-transferase CaiB-like acyl-CoA transferase
LRALKNIRVLDFGQFVAGPLCGLLLAQLGAEVIRIERPRGGPDRDVQPLSANEPGGAMYRHLNRGKRSLAIDVFHEAAKPVLDSLIARSDVVIANVPPQTLQQMRLTLDCIQKINPSIILASTSAFGAAGPLAHLPGFDGVGQAMSGAMHLTGRDAEPRKAFVHYVDYLTATLSAYGVMAALRTRDLDGRGQEVSTSLLGSALFAMANNLMEEAALRVNRTGTGNRAQLSAPADVFAARDGHVLLQTVGGSMFKRCALLLRRPDWLTDEGLTDDAARGRRGAELSEVVGSWCATRTVAQCLEEFASAGLPAAAVLSPREALGNSAISSGRFWSDDCGLPLFKVPLGLSSQDAVELRPAPAIGADTAAILHESGIGTEQIAALNAAGALRFAGDQGDASA